MSLEPITLLTLPEVVKDHLMEYLNYIDIVRLRKTCHVFRNYLIAKLPDATIPTVEVVQKEESMVLRCRTKYLKDLLKIEYKKVNEGCSIEANIEQGDTRIVRANGQNYMDVFCQDFTMLLQHQKLISEELDFSALAYPENRSEFWNTIRRVMENTEAATGKRLLLKNKKLTLQNVSAPHVFSIFNYLDPNCLKRIFLNGEHGDAIDGIVELPHWDNLKTVIIGRFFMRNIPQNITHLQNFFAYVKDFTAEDVLQIKKIMLRSGQLKKCTFLFNSNQDESFQQSLGPIFEEGKHCSETKKTWKFDSPIPGKVLKISLFGPVISFEMK
ncbi:hypothetical protein GCK72_021391 [Caenorhabditis remanei]|uniref:F-box domain-containing protein n=1 Tax=Caenorhabditis remanei TaxID=31234 RepID=A0A6A5GI12_CAERE|nr:hypothetical protein GCK72_021391 [Caenorhabditis remanei]KAF1754827.1 hypothetical protein GCK72_021391 [Caenorhabditis remanei]